MSTSPSTAACAARVHEQPNIGHPDESERSPAAIPVLPVSGLGTPEIEFFESWTGDEVVAVQADDENDLVPKRWRREKRDTYIQHRPFDKRKGHSAQMAPTRYQDDIRNKYTKGQVHELQATIDYIDGYHSRMPDDDERQPICMDDIVDYASVCATMSTRLERHEQSAEAQWETKRKQQNQKQMSTQTSKRRGKFHESGQDRFHEMGGLSRGLIWDGHRTKNVHRTDTGSHILNTLDI